MKFNEARKKVLNTDWYFQAAAVKRLYISYPWYSCSQFRVFGKKIPIKYEVHATIHNNFMDDYISKTSLKRGAFYYLKRQKNDRNFIYKLFANWQKSFALPLLKFNKRIIQSDLSELTNEELLALFGDYSSLYVKSWQELIFLDCFDFWGENVFRNALDRERTKLTQEKLDLLLVPPKPSFLQRERMDVLSLAEKILKYKKNSDIKFREISNELEKISKKYYWLNNDYASVEYLDRNYFNKKVKKLMAGKVQLEKERKMKNQLARLEANKQKVIRKHKLSKSFTNCCSFLAILGNMRDERKSFNQMAGNTLGKFAEEFARRTSLTTSQVEQIYFNEMENIFKKEAYFFKLTLKREKTPGFYYIYGPGKFHEFLTPSSIKLNLELKSKNQSSETLRGMSAFRGFAKAKAKIIKNKNDFHKMRRGDILIAPNTRPEYLPIMKLASAIITEEGGITCHAAIVSRELKIPCVVGVQGITNVLKDGDLVEVDANRGIITILMNN